MSTAVGATGAAELDRPTAARPAPLPDGVGRNELGTITVSDTVVGKVAARAAVEVPDAGAAAPRVLGRLLAGTGRLGGRETSLTTPPKASAQVEGRFARVELELSIRWPESIPAVSREVQRNVQRRVAELTGLQVAEVTIRVTDLVTSPPAAPRVR